MKIAIVSDAVAPWHVGGKEHRYREILAELAKRDGGETDEITIYTMRWWNGEAPVGHRALMPLMRMYRSDGRRSSLQGACFAIACLRMLFVKADVIEADHMPGPQLLTLALVAKLTRRPLVVSWHEHWGRAGWKAYLPKIWWIGAGIEWLGAKAADVVVAGIEETRGRLIAAGVPAERVVLVPYGVHVEGDAAVGAVRSGAVTFGRQVPHKRFDLAIEAVAILAERGIRITLRMIGDGPERANLEALAVARGVADLVHFTGSLPTQRDVWAEVAQSEVCIMPSEREGFGLAVAEALWLGTPLVVSDHRDNAAKSLVDDGETGVIIRSGDAEAIAEGIERARRMDHVHIAERFRSSGRAVRWEESARRLRETWGRAARCTT
jgi:glycosyltransferase involved in cell wall biosynthesis